MDMKKSEKGAGWKVFGVSMGVLLSSLLSVADVAAVRGFDNPNTRQRPVMGEKRIKTKLRPVKVDHQNSIFDGNTQDLKAMFGNELNGSDLILENVQKDKLGYRHFRHAQYYKGLPVIGAEIIVHVKSSKKIYTVGGKYAPGLDISVEPGISPESAIDVGLDDLGSGQVTERPSLVIYEGNLAYYFVLSSKKGEEPAQWHFYVDAHAGKILFRFNNIQSAPPGTSGSHTTVSGNRLAGEDGSSVSMEGWQDTGGNYFIYNKGTGSTAGKWGVYDRDVLDWEQKATADWGTDDPAAVSLGKNFEDTQNWVSTILGMNSFDDAGAFAQANVHEGTNYVNAYWDGSQFYFGDGDGSTANALTVLDIAAHEYAHAVTQYTSNLTYSYESGALNESFSDIMGALVEFYYQTDGTSSYPTGTPGQSDWLLGEDSWLADDALRDLQDPQRFGQPSCYKGTSWYTGSGDNGGVHINSGVQNFVYYLLSEGGSGTNDGNTYTITGLGRAQAGEIAMRANTVYLVSSSQYADARDAWIQSAADLGYDVQTVTDAWTAAWCDIPPEPVAYCPDGETPSYLFSDDLENTNSGNWINTLATGVNHWNGGVGTPDIYFSTNPNSGSYSLFGQDYSSQGDSSVEMSAGVTLPASARMQFEHDFDFETNWDGGVIEFSTDGGTNWSDAGSMISAGQTYNGTLRSSNPLGFRQAFTGNIGSYVSTQLDLSSLAGSQVIFRFRAGTDSSVGATGWYVDDPAIYTCSSTSAASDKLVIVREKAFPGTYELEVDDVPGVVDGTITTVASDAFIGRGVVDIGGGVSSLTNGNENISLLVSPFQPGAQDLLAIHAPPTVVGGDIGTPVDSDNTMKANNRYVTQGDFDNDAEDEVVVIQQLSFGAYVAFFYEMPVSGSTGTQISSIFLGPNVAAVSSGEVNGDGSTDLVVLREKQTGGFMLMVYDGADAIAGTQTLIANDPDVGTDVAYKGVTVGNFDGDAGLEVTLVREYTATPGSFYLEIYDMPASVGGDIGPVIASDSDIGTRFHAVASIP